MFEEVIDNVTEEKSNYGLELQPSGMVYTKCRPQKRSQMLKMKNAELEKCLLFEINMAACGNHILLHA